MKNLINVFCVTDYFEPGYLGGGPIVTISNLRKKLQGVINLCIYTRDRDLGSKVKYASIQTDQWIDSIDGKIFYASPIKFGAFGLMAALSSERFDIAYLNSFFSFRGSILPYALIRITRPKMKVILAPRGEFSLGALNIKKFKKTVFVTLVRFLNFYRSIHWHVSTELEADDVLRVFPNSVGFVHVAPDPVSTNLIVSSQVEAKKIQGKLRLVFISRLVRKKNLDGLLKILSTLRSEIELNVYGPHEDEEYLMSCFDLIRILPTNLTVHVHGPIAPDSVSDTFAKYDLFAFPTHGENFGHVIYESLCAGTPVIVSDQTPWKKDAEGALNVIPCHDIDSWRIAIQNAANRTADEHEVFRRSARRYAESYESRDDSFKKNIKMFVDVANGSF